MVDTHLSESGDLSTSRERPAYAWRTLGLWSLIASMILVWWMAVYAGWLAPLGEWQFARFGRFYPTLTVMALAALAIVPIGLIIRARHRHLRRKRREAMAAPDVVGRQGIEHAMRSAHRAQWLFGAVAICALMLGTAALIVPLLNPPATGAPVAIGASDRNLWREGPARLSGTYRLGPVGRFEERFLFIRHTIHVAPVFAIGGGPARLLTVVEKRATAPGYRPIGEGTLVPHGVPRELMYLYRNAGIAVTERPALLLRGEVQRTWRYRTLAAEAFVVALLAGSFYLAFRRHRRRLAERSAAIEAGVAADG